MKTDHPYILHYFVFIWKEKQYLWSLFARNLLNRPLSVNYYYRVLFPHFVLLRKEKQSDVGTVKC